MLAAMRRPISPPADVRAWCQEWLPARPGQLEEARALVPVAPAESVAPGRGGRRLAMLAAVFQHLVDLAEGIPSPR